MNNEEELNELKELGGESPYTEFEKLAKKLLEEAKRIHPDGGIVLTYVAPGAQNIGHLETQIINQGIQSDPSNNKKNVLDFAEEPVLEDR